MKREAETHIPIHVPASEENAEVVSGGYECADPPPEGSGNYSGHDVADDNSNMPQTVKESLECSEGLNPTNDADSEIRSLGGGDNEVVSVPVTLDTGPSIESSTSELVTGSSTSKPFTGLEKPGDNMSNIKLFSTLLGDDVSMNTAVIVHYMCTAPSLALALPTLFTLSLCLCRWQLAIAVQVTWWSLRLARYDVLVICKLFTDVCVC